MLIRLKIKDSNLGALVILLSFIFLPGNAFSNSYYVSGTYTSGVSIYVKANGSNSGSAGTSINTPAATLTWLYNKYGPAGTNVLTNGDIIYVDAGTYYKTEEKLQITVSGLTIKGAGTGVTIFDDNYNGSASCSIYFMNILGNNITISDFSVERYDYSSTNFGQAITIGDGSTAYSGILVFNIEILYNGGCGGSPSIMVLAQTTSTIQAGGSLCNVSGTDYSGGIGVLGTNINLTIKDYVLSGNSRLAVYGGGGLSVCGTNTTKVYLMNSTISNNASTNGGGIISCGFLVISDCIIESNYTGTSGGSPVFGSGIYVTGGTTIIRRSIIRNNKVNPSYTGSSVYGAGIYVDNTGDWTTNSFSTSSSVVTIDSTSFSGNVAGSNSKGHDVYGKAGTISFNDVTFGTTADQIEQNSATISYTKCGTTALQNGSAIAGGANPDYTPNPAPPYPSSTTCTLSIAVLPISLTQFQGQCINNQIELMWQTATEANNKLFNIERSTDCIHFNVIGQVNGSGNSTHTINYKFTDNSNDASAYYRLSQVDYNDNISRSGIIYVAHNCIAKVVSEITVFPNPATSQVTLNLTVFQTVNLELEIYNNLGILVKSIPHQALETGIQAINIDITELASGFYFLKTSLNDQIYINRIIKQH